MDQPCNLHNIKRALELAFLELDFDQIKDQDVVLAVGNTGSGKSTMLTALIFGPNELHLTKIKKEIRLADGRKKVKLIPVIE